ncbi:hypothetical protein, partial [Klebsiella aerogenes]|uniref:hypothetical protein n=1 Tax=Klebsiella aerogenes TaxID=548 RepID=UPI001CC62FC5
MDKLSRQCRNGLDELMLLAPWLSYPVVDEILIKYPEFNVIPTLREIANIDADRLLTDKKDSITGEVPH